MLKVGTYLAIQGLWSTAGIFTMVLGAVAETDIWIRVVVALCGVLSLLLSLLLGGFVKHIIGHEEYSRGLYRELDTRAERLFGELHDSMTESKCKALHAALEASVEKRLASFDDRLRRIEPPDAHNP